LPVIPAVANALADALGIRIDEVPITPDKVLAALEGRYKPPTMPAYRYPETVVVPPLEQAVPSPRSAGRG
jgi:hypothetical protein